MNAIVVVDKNWGIGKNNDLLFSIAEDMLYFRKLTLNKVIVMGRNTLLSFPNSQPLKNRTNIVLFPEGQEGEGYILVRSLKELSVELEKYPPDDVFIVGGAMFYKTMLNYCDKVYVTKVDADGKAQVFFENLDTCENFKLQSKGQSFLASGFNISFDVYKNLNTQKF